MKSTAMIPLILGGVVGLIAVKFGADAIRRAQGTPAETVNTVVALVDIPASYEVTPDMVGVVETPKTPLIPDGAFSRAEELAGRVTSKAIPQGSVIAPTSLAPPGTLSGLTERIPEGFRAVSVKIDEVSGVAGQIKPGDYVDVIVVMKVKRSRGSETISRIILQRVKVLAVGQSLASGSSSGPKKMAKSATLLVTDTDVPRLHLAQTQGKVALAMRGADDRLMADGDGLASTSEWNGDQTQERPTRSEARQSPTTPAERPGIALAQVEPPGPIFQAYTVTVVNGPLRAKGTTTVQRVTYQDRSSMRVTSVSTGRTGEGSAKSADSAESIMRRPRRTRTGANADRAAQRESQWSGGSDQPQDREITRE